VTTSGTAVGRALAHLEALVGFDTTNPPRRIDGSGIFAYVRHSLGPSFHFDTENLGDGCVSLLATRGHPRRLFNFHLDTVPADPAWKQDPFRLEIRGGRAIGLGVADIKGAAACMLTALEQTDGPAAVLFTSDEEAGRGRCVPSYLSRRDSWDSVVVAEPTRGRALVEHRGLGIAAGTFAGRSGHASAERALEDSATHEAVRWAARALDYAEAQETQSFGPLRGIRFNLGILQGGTKPNMIASEAGVRFAVRPLPGQRLEEVVAAIQACARDSGRVAWEPGFAGPPLPTGGAETAARTRAMVGALGLEPAPPADFWSEAALFSAAGHPSFVYGPGDIAQAHTAGEWVDSDDLGAAVATYRRLLAT